MEVANPMSELKMHTKLNEGDITPRPLQICKRDSKWTEANVSDKSTSTISPSQRNLIPTRRSSIRLDTCTQLDISPRETARSKPTPAHRHDFLNVRKQRRSDPIHVNVSGGGLFLASSLAGLVHMPALEVADKPSLTGCRPQQEATTRLGSNQRPFGRTLRSHSSGATKNSSSSAAITDHPSVAPVPALLLGHPRRAVTDGGISIDAGSEHQLMDRSLRRQPSSKRSMISRMMSGLTGKTHVNHIPTIGGDGSSSPKPHHISDRHEPGMANARCSTSSSNTGSRIGSDLGAVLAAFPTPPKSYATSPTTTEGSFETSRSNTQIYRELSKPKKTTALAIELSIIPEFDQISFENSDSMFVAIDVKAAFTTENSEVANGISSAGLDIVAIIDNSLYTSPTSLMAACETVRFLASILDNDTDRLAIVCTSSSENRAHNPELIAPLSKVKMQKLKSVLDTITSSALPSGGSNQANAVHIAQESLFNATIDPANMPLHETYGHIFLIAVHVDESIRNLVTDENLTLHLICPGTLPRAIEHGPNSNGWRLRSLTGKGPRILNGKKKVDSLDNLFGGLQVLVQRARSGQMLEALRDVRLNVEAGPDCSIEDIYGQKYFALLQPGETHSVVVKIRGRKPKAAEAWLSGTVPSLDVGELFGELERMLLGFAATPILTANLSYCHPLLSSKTMCQMTETCEVRRFITAPGENRLSRRPNWLLETENRVTVHQRLAYHYVTQLSLQGAVSALAKVIDDGDGRFACPGYVALLMKEKKFQARVGQRLSIAESPQKPARSPNRQENRGPDCMPIGNLDVGPSDELRLTENPSSPWAGRNGRIVEDDSKSDAARRIWENIRLKSRPYGSFVDERNVSSQDKEERSRALREAALRNKRSIGTDTLRSLSSSEKSPTGLATPWL